MASRIAHRGPDAAGYWQSGGVALAHRRLSIVDVAGGDQPVANEDGSVIVVFNGEIYNHVELREWLCRRGHRFRTRGDTEVLVHLYEEHGARLVERLRGMFAFALWDAGTRQLLLARDRIGIKPLYIYRDQQKVVFGSEIKAILAHPQVPRELDLTAFEQYMTFGNTGGERSIFRRIEKLLPAHLLTLTSRTLDRPPTRYWQLVARPDFRTRPEEWSEQICAKVDETVALHLMSDVPVGAFLSGGLDSSVIVASAARASAALQTFSIGFEEEPYNELPFARAVAEQFGTDHVERIASNDAVRLIEDLAYHCDEPFADASAIPSLMVSRLASQRVKVVLSGDGGDEAFGGYSRYAGDEREAALRRLVPAAVRRFALAPAARLWPRTDWLPRSLRAKTLLTNLALDPARAYANTVTMCRQPLRRRLMAPDVVSALDGYDPARAIADSYEAAAHDGPVAAMMAADIAVRLPDDYLVKVDRTSMACGLEVRPPFLDHELMELAARIPAPLKVRNGVTKWILKQSYGPRLPAVVCNRRKQGFEIPIHAWFQGPLKEMFESTVLASRSAAADLLDRDTVRRVYRAHVSGRARYGHVLWTLLMFSQWSRRYLAEERAA
jgi:asparagine synthase (glutamine-hydrolysing)